ncbi:hypothetical protein NDU88_001362 [Pleurodeles waltl]|uniref:Uncharacterized protein n=1 Tax=Pleurodeles waltl TaxID=8319 RepID=A0AAV7W004_PLEWA|nr:hypothetical protein NDU88_001362 [Pleurodeles waltl]
MEAATYPTVLRLRLPPAGANSDGRNASWKLPRVQELSSSLRRLTTGDGSHVSGGACVRGRVGLVAVLAVVSVEAVLAAVHGSAPAEGYSRTSPAASDGCPLGNWLRTVGGGMSLPLLRGTLAALMGGALDDPAVAGTTVPGDLVAEVLGWDLESLALGEGRGEVKGRGQGLPGKVFWEWEWR